MEIIKKFKRLFGDSGLILGCFRLPSKVLKFILDTVNTNFYRIFLKGVGKKFTIEWGASIESPGRVIVGDNVFIGRGTKILSELDHGFLCLAENVEVGRECRIDITGDLYIARDVLLSRGCQILTHSHGLKPRSKPYKKSLTIRERVWIGSEAIVMDRCDYIERGTIIGARSVVTKSFLDPNSIIAGTPAAKIGDYID